MREESGRVKGQLETCRRELEEVRRKLREKEAAAESSVEGMRQDLASRAQQVGHMTLQGSGGQSHDSQG